MKSGSETELAPHRRVGAALQGPSHVRCWHRTRPQNLRDLADLGGWKNPQTVLTVYQQPEIEIQRQSLASHKSAEEWQRPKRPAASKYFWRIARLFLRRNHVSYICPTRPRTLRTRCRSVPTRIGTLPTRPGTHFTRSACFRGFAPRLCAGNYPRLTRKCRPRTSSEDWHFQLFSVRLT